MGKKFSYEVACKLGKATKNTNGVEFTYPVGTALKVFGVQHVAKNRGGHKYNVSKKEDRTMDGIVFDSKLEMTRYAELKMLERVGKISKLQLQPKFLLIPKTERGGRASYYTADFTYIEEGKIIVEDAKGFRTDVYKLKKKLLLWRYPNICFIETGG